MSAAAMAAQMNTLNKPLLEQAFQQIHQSMDQLPADIDWLQFQAGVSRYASAQTTAAPTIYPTIATAGRVTLQNAGGEGPPVLIIPSMVNKGYVLDLHPGFSLVEHLRKSGFTVLLIDWGTPDATNSQSLTSIITESLEPLILKAHKEFGPLSLFGYCMGGLLALAATVRLNTAATPPIHRLSIAAMPWDFSASTTSQHIQWARPVLEPYLGTTGVIPPEIMSQYFWSLDPWGPIRRLMAYGKEIDPARLAHLTALEDWLNDGLPLDGPIAKEMLFDWYGSNLPMKGQWKVGETLILPQNINCPLWVCVTQKDVLVPLNSSLPFLGQTKGAQVVMADTGHVGLVCGRRAQTTFYDPLTTWLKSPL
jgi:polyhydroxyalkanoate synthase